MKRNLLQHVGAITVAGALLLGTGAQAAVYEFNLTGVVADGSYSTSGATQFYSLSLVTDELFESFELQIGDVINLNVTLDSFLDVPAASGVTFFGVDILTTGQFATPPDDGVISSGEVALLDGNLAGNIYGSACSNCVASSLVLSPGPAFSVSQFSTNLTIENLTPLDPDDTSPFFVTGFRLGYQLTDDGGPGTVPGVVPEPATWAMMIMGFGLSGAVLRRRRLLTA